LETLGIDDEIVNCGLKNDVCNNTYLLLSALFFFFSKARQGLEGPPVRFYGLVRALLYISIKVFIYGRAHSKR
jgi:hypothetical protein